MFAPIESHVFSFELIKALFRKFSFLSVGIIVHSCQSYSWLEY